ncbi:MAG: hypothetical protein SNG27_00200 [Rikenellaceae bacterium]
MIELLIDGVSCDVDSGSTIVLSYDSQRLEDLDTMSDGESASVVIPSSSVNDAIFGDDGWIHAPKRFNAVEHTAEVWCQGEMLFSGAAYLQEVVWDGGKMSYEVLIRAQRALWAQTAAESTFNEFAVDLNMYLAKAYIKAQWESDDAVKFVAVRRDTYEAVQSAVSNEVVREIVSLEDYHPFLSVEAMMRSVFESTGYTVKSDFMESDYFKSLYMSGSYGSSTNSTETKNAMDFYVKRSSDCTVNGDYRGRVYMTPYYAANTVGMVVDPDTVNTDKDCYSYSGCFQTYNTVPAFVPTVQVYVGFEVRLCYITPYKIKSRELLTAYNSVHLCVGHDYELDIVNNFEDKRGSLSSSFSYMLCIFDFDESTDNVSLYCRLESGSMLHYGAITERVTYFTTPSQPIAELVLVYNLSDGSQEIFAKDWAIYNGYIEETGSTEVDVTLKITPELISPSSPKKFDEMYIDCGEEGWEFTLLEATSITPYFAKHPGVNAKLSFADVAQHDKFQSSLVESIAHMYNLRFWTDDINKVVYVEPNDDMWDTTTVWDWSDKIDPDSAIEIGDLAEEVYRIRKWGYRDGDGVTARGDGDIPADDEFGFWSGEINSMIAKEGTESLLSPLYSPTQNDDQGLLQVGDRDDLDNVNSFDFTPRIVRCEGRLLYEGSQMPYMAFYQPDIGVSLCFEDRGGVEGLNSYYAEQIATEERARIVSLRLRLEPFDVANLFMKSGVAPNITSTFGFDLGGDWTRCRLKEIVEYDPLKEVTVCRFIVVD